MKCVQFEQEKNYIRDFLSLPKRLYTSDNNTENPKETEKLLLGTHPLSKYFTLHKFLVYQQEMIVGRFVLTTYPSDGNAYIGFYECVDDPEVAGFLLEKAEEYAQKAGYERIVGPVDASFWVKYRLKINLFDRRPYTGEPYNKDYYLKQFQDNGYVIAQHYTSNSYTVLEGEEPLYDGRYSSFVEKGYQIISPAKEDYDKVIRELYELITDLYSDFPVYKDVSYEDFTQVFSDYRYIINMSMVKMAYYDNQPVGFFISVPDYNNSVYHLNHIGNLVRILRLKKKPKRYVMLYMGVHRDHRGLGKALVGSIMEELRKSGLPSIGALARDGKVTQKYGDNYIENQYEYVLLEKEIGK